jgi:hypothetical protein
MKIYFAGTTSRESMGLNKKLGVKNHLESYVAFNSKDTEKLFKKLFGEENENQNKVTTRNT